MSLETLRADYKQRIVRNEQAMQKCILAAKEHLHDNRNWYNAFKALQKAYEFEGKIALDEIVLQDVERLIMEVKK